MQHFLEKMGEKKFLIFSAISCFLGDLLIALYIRYIFIDFEKFKILFQQVLEIQGLNAQQFDPQFIEGQFYLIKNSIIMLLLFMLIIQFVVYVLYYLKKQSALRYVQMTLWLTLPTTLYFVYEALSINKIFALLFLIQTPLYFVSFQGNRFFFKKNEAKKEE